jgi:hypothetical protein
MHRLQRFTYPRPVTMSSPNSPDALHAGQSSNGPVMKSR